MVLNLCVVWYLPVKPRLTMDNEIDEKCYKKIYQNLLIRLRVRGWNLRIVEVCGGEIAVKSKLGEGKCISR